MNRALHTVVGKALAALLIFALIAASATQLLPRCAGMQTPCDQMSISLTDVSPDPQADGDNSERPCEGTPPGCLDCLGSLSVAAMPPPSVAPATLRWNAVIYSLSFPGHSGRSVKPELLPPIFFA